MLTKELFDLLEINPETKVAIVSHNDLDGVGPVIIAKNYFKDCKYFNVANHVVDKVTKLALFAPDYADRDVVFITDCSVTDEELINTIDELNKLTTKKILLFDHHGTASGLNKYDWAHVTEEEGVSGTKLFWRYMEEKVVEELNTSQFMLLDHLVQMISDYDTWKWVEKNRPECKQLSEFFSNTGVEFFLDKYVGNALNYYEAFNVFSPRDTALLRDYATKDKYLIFPNVEKSARIMDYTFSYNGETITKKVKCVTVASSIGDMAERLYEDGIDVIFFFYHDSLSARCRCEDLNLGEWCKLMGNGGGHSKSAGFRLNADNVQIYFQYLLLKFQK